LSLPLWHTRTLQKLYEILFENHFLSEGGFGLVFSRRVRYQLVRDFLTPEESPRNERGNLCSENRLLRIEIRADYQFVLADQP
jgi:hypothetical protein